MKNYFLIAAIPMLISTVSSAAESIACTPIDDPDGIVILMHKMNRAQSYRVTIAEGFAPKYIADQTVNLAKNQNSDILSVKTEKREIKFTLSKGFLNKAAVEEENSSEGTIQISEANAKVNEKIVCFIYE